MIMNNNEAYKGLQTLTEWKPNVVLLQIFLKQYSEGSWDGRENLHVNM